MDENHKIVVFKSETFTCAHHNGHTTATKHTQYIHSTDHDYGIINPHKHSNSSGSSTATVELGQEASDVEFRESDAP